MISSTGLLYNMSCPPRTWVEVAQHPVAPRLFIFSLPAILPVLKSPHPEQVGRKSIFDLGYADIPTLAEVEAAAERLPGFLIGSPDGRGTVRKVTVRSVALVIAILSRRIDGLFIKGRPPDYSLASLVESSFRVEDWRDQKTIRGAQP